jgi:hypothetical protein
MAFNATTDRIFQVHRELGKILDDLGLAARLPQALLDRLNAMRTSLLQDLNSSVSANADENSLCAVPLPGGSGVHDCRRAEPSGSAPNSEQAEEDALLRLDDDGGAYPFSPCNPM